jgi:hypothetical protein
MFSSCFLLVFFLFSSCFLLVFFLFIQCDSTENTIESIKKPYVTSEKVSLANVLSVLKNPVILNQTETFKTNTQESMTQKGGEKPNLYFTKIVKGNEYTTYLLLLNSYSTKNPYFMYYVITQNATTEKVGYLKYIPDTPIAFIDIKSFSGKIQILDLKHRIRTESRILNGQPQKQTTAVTARTTDDCTSSTSIITHYCGSNAAHSPGQNCTDPTRAYYEVLITTTCPYVSGYDNSAPVPNEFMNPSEGGAGGGGPNAISDLTIFFEGILSPKQKMWWDNYNNDPQKQEIITYLNQKSTNEGILFSLDMIDQMRTNFGLILDVDASSKSPANIDRSSIPHDLTKPENQKFNAVYDALKDSPEFKKLFIDLFQDNNRFNVKFLIGNIASGASGDTDTDLSNPTLNTITISPSFLLNNNKMTIAKTIAHECIHAFLNVKLCDAGQGMSIPTLNNMDFYNIVNQQYNGFNGSQDQHNFIYNFMLPTLKIILADMKDTLVTPAESQSLEELFFHPISPTQDVPFNWNDFYLNLSLGGLQSCTFFQNEIGTIIIDANGLPVILNTIDPVKMYFFNKYNQYIHDNLRH